MSGLERWFENPDYAGMAKWLASRPKVVRDLLTEFPILSRLEAKGETWVVIGATESGALIIAPMASESYKDAFERRQNLCADCQRRGDLHWVQP